MSHINIITLTKLVLFAAVWRKSQLTFKGTMLRDFLPQAFFHESPSPKPLKITLGAFRIFISKFFENSWKKTRSRKSRDTVPLRVLILFKFFIKEHIINTYHFTPNFYDKWHIIYYFPIWGEGGKGTIGTYCKPMIRFTLSQQKYKTRNAPPPLPHPLPWWNWKD